MKPSEKFKNPNVAPPLRHSKGDVLADIVRILDEHDANRRRIMAKGQHDRRLVDNASDTVSALSIAMQTLFVLVPELEAIELLVLTGRTLMTLRNIAPDASRFGKRIINANVAVSKVRDVQRLDSELSAMASMILSLNDPKDAESKMEMTTRFEEMTIKRNKANVINPEVLKRVGMDMIISVSTDMMVQAFPGFGGVTKMIKTLALKHSRLDAQDMTGISKLTLDYPELTHKIKLLFDNTSFLEPERLAVNAILIALATSQIRSNSYGENITFEATQSPYETIAQAWGLNDKEGSQFDFSVLHPNPTPGLLSKPRT